jgi:thiol-disulfide isomerase/thioredoxin
MKLLNVYLTVAALLLSLQSIAQKNSEEPKQLQFKRLQIGDTVPMESIAFNNVRNYPGGKAKLSDFKGKYIILDFWTKGCSSCIAAFPRMEALQNQFKDDIQVLLVTKNSENDLALLLKNSPNLKNTKLPVIIGDQILATQIFPHGVVPYHVWLDKDGKVMATTWAQETTSEHVKELISGKSMKHILIRSETFPDYSSVLSKRLQGELNNPRISLLTIDNGRYSRLLQYFIPIRTSYNLDTISQVLSRDSLKNISRYPFYSIFMRYNLEAEGLAAAPKGELINEVGKSVGLRLINSRIELLYRRAYNALNDEIILVEGNAKLLYEKWRDSTNARRDLANNWYSYESHMPDYSPQKGMELLQQDLTRFFGIKGSIEERPIRCLVLTMLGTEKEENLWMKDQNVPVEDYKNAKPENGGYAFRNIDFGGLIGKLQNANRRGGSVNIIDETGIMWGNKSTKKINLFLNLKSLEATAENLPRLNKELGEYGLGFKEEIRTMKVLVLRAAF